MGGTIGVATRLVLGADRIELLRRGAGAVERGGLEMRSVPSRPIPTRTKE